MRVQSVLGLHSLKTTQYRFNTTKEWLIEKTKGRAMLETRQQYETQRSYALYERQKTFFFCNCDHTKYKNNLSVYALIYS